MQRILSNRKRVLVWAVPLAAGFLAVFLAVRAYRMLHPNYPAYVLGMSREMRMQPGDAAELDYIHDRAAAGDTPTAAQWRTIEGLIQGDDIPRKRFALLILGQLYRTSYRQTAIGYAKGLLNVPDSQVRARSIAVLARLHYSGWKELALQNQYSPDPILRSSAVALLERQDRFR